MLIEPSYFLILFENGKSKDYMNSRCKRIDKDLFNLLVDINITEFEAENNLYKIVERRSFYINTTTDCSMYVVVDGEKIS